MGLWRKFVSVIAGTMIAAGGILGTLAVLDAVSPAPGAPEPASSPWLFDAQSAEVAVVSDVDVVGSWLNDTAGAGATPTPEEAFDASVAASAFADAATAEERAGVRGGQAFEPAAADASAAGAQAVQDAGTIVVAFGADGVAGDPQTDEELAAQADEALVHSTTAWAMGDYALSAGAGEVVASGPAVADTPLSNASAAVAAASTATVARLATIPAPVQAHANWTTAARVELVERADGGTLGQDTLSLALASQGLEGPRPESAAAINAELRFRQRSDGSFAGDVPATAEAVRALGFSPDSNDRWAAVRGLDWLDAQGPLAPQEATYRLRAHAVDGALWSGAPGAAPSEEAMMGPSFLGSKAVLAFFFLAGGIGLSLTLVTNDALKGVRRRLYDTIRAEPGLHVNELRRRLAMSPSSIEYHLSVLVGAGLVVSEDDGRYKRFYANGAGLGLNPRSPNSRNALGALRRPHATEIMQHLLEREDGTAREVSRALSLHESAASRRLDHLERAGLLQSQRVGRERRYRVRERQAALKALGLVDGAAGPVPAGGGIPEASPERAPPERASAEGATAASP